MKYIIGITGGIATGKSYVSNFIRKMGYHVIDTDLICHELYEYNNRGYKEIEKHFNEVIVDSKVDRKKLATTIFNNEEKRMLLNSLIHPLIKEEVLKQINELSDKIIFIDVPLMYESGFDLMCDNIICVYTKYEVELKRLIERDKLSQNDAILRIKSQMDLELKKSKSKYLIESMDDFNATNENILKTIRKIEEDYNA